MIFRKATIEDCDLLYKWANESAVRQNSFNSEEIKYEDHVKWFEKKLKSPESFLYICMDEGRPIGQIRIEVEEGIGLINFSVDSSCRGKGYGKKMLEQITGVIKEEKVNVTKLNGRVKPENTPSKKAFESAGYELVKSEESLEYEKKTDCLFIKL